MKQSGWWVAWRLSVGVAFLGVAGQSAALEQSACPPRDKPVQVDVRFEQTRPFVDDSRSRAWIQDNARALHHPIGLTASQLSHTLTVHFEVSGAEDRRSRCLYLRKLSLLLTYPETKIYIANAYPAGSCEYQAIYRHEMEHVQVLNAHQERHLSDWRDHLQELARGVRPLLSGNPKQTQQEVLQRLDQKVRKEIERLDRYQKAAQAEIDTPQNYAKVRASCQGW
ncbi:MAG: hypothetical protein H7837_10095 [Magnetococcus sp. MYC-9]